MSAHEPERDPVTGQVTTGHEWNGIKELNSPVPRVVFAALIAGVIYMAVATLLLPAWPGVSSYWRGLLGIDQKTSVQAQLAIAEAEKAQWLDAIAQTDLDSLSHDPELMAVVREVGAPIFGDNCAACHTAQGTGQTDYPNLVDAPLMWGDDLETIAQTIRVGINSPHPQTRYANMLAFGRDGMLGRSDISTLVSYLDDLQTAPKADVDAASPEGAALFAANCASCHGADGEGISLMGTPNLVDPFWIYGGARQDLFDSIYAGRAGHMPHWEGRLAETDIRILALYLNDLRAGRD